MQIEVILAHSPTLTLRRQLKMAPPRLYRLASFASICLASSQGRKVGLAVLCVRLGFRSHVHVRCLTASRISSRDAHDSVNVSVYLRPMTSESLSKQSLSNLGSSHLFSMLDLIGCLRHAMYRLTLIICRRVKPEIFFSGRSLTLDAPQTHLSSATRVPWPRTSHQSQPSYDSWFPGWRFGASASGARSHTSDRRHSPAYIRYQAAAVAITMQPAKTR